MEEYKITKIKEYFANILDGTIKKLNIDFLDAKIESYSLVRMPVQPVIEKWIIPIVKRREVYNFTSRKIYSKDVDTNLKNIGFYEDIESKIIQNNKNKMLPDIKGIEEIECLNCGSMQNTTNETAIFSIQIQITYREEY